MIDVSRLLILSNRRFLRAFSIFRDRLVTKIKRANVAIFLLIGRYRLAFLIKRVSSLIMRRSFYSEGIIRR